MTREKARVDRIAPPGLIPRFVDPTAGFRNAPADPVLTVSQRERAIQFDGPEAGLDHRGEDEVEHVRFDAITWTYRLREPALLELAKIVRVADGGSAGAVQAAGWKAAADGFRAAARDDLENQRLQFPLYDARYEHGRLRLAPSGTERSPP